jgi:hypothetical protein
MRRRFRSLRINTLGMPGSLVASYLMPPPAGPLWIVILAIMTILATLAVIYVILWGGSKFQKRFFPVGTFAIGQGQERYRVDELWRWGALIGLGISTVGSIIAGVLLLLAGLGGSP